MSKSKWMLVVLALCGAQALAQPALEDEADDEGAPRAKYVAGLVGYTMPDSDLVTSESGENAAALFGVKLGSRLGLEFNLTSSTFETGVEGTTDFYQQALTFDL